MAALLARSTRTPRSRAVGGTAVVLLGGGVVLAAGIGRLTAASAELAVLAASVLLLGAIALLRPAAVPVLAVPAMIAAAVIPGLGPLRQLGLVALVGVALLALVQRRHPLRDTRAAWPLLALGGWVTFVSVVVGLTPVPCPYSTCAAPNVDPRIELTSFLLLIAAGAAAAVLRPSSTSVLRVLYGSAAVVSFGVLFGLFPDANLDSAGRAAALDLNANYLGTFLACGLVAAVVSATFGPGARVVPAAVCALVAPALLATRSRGAFIATVVGVLLTIAVGRSRRWVVAALAVGGLLVVVAPSALDLLGAASRAGRSSQELANNNESRAGAARIALEVAIDNPLVGIGYGQFPPVALAEPSFNRYMNTHNEPLRMAAETGLAGAALLLTCFGLAIHRARRAPGVRAVVATMGVALLFGNFLSNPLVSLPAWLLLGAALALGNDTDPAPEAPAAAPAPMTPLAAAGAGGPTAPARARPVDWTTPAHPSMRVRGGPRIGEQVRRSRAEALFPREETGARAGERLPTSGRPRAR